MFERPQGGEKVILVAVSPQGAVDPDELQEFRELAVSAGAEICAIVTTSRRSPDPRFFIGKGKAEEIRFQVESEDVGLVIFDHALSPSQERNLEALFQCRVLDRPGLIMDIFSQRARSFEGKLQVELAQLRHLSTRLVRGWTHLERQKGGIGLRGPGETQLETDRRLIRQRIDQITRRLQKVDSQRGQGCRARRRANVPTVSLVGYTNAGKSTLFNALTQAHVYVQDQLFATLDPTLRRLNLPEGENLVLADTVGFISRLPHELVAAFKSTLQETTEASLLLHVIDAASHRREENILEVEDVLRQIGADAVPRLEVYNKIDLLQGVEAHIDRDGAGQVQRVWCSAQSGAGLDLLIEALQERFREARVRRHVHLRPSEGRLRALLFEQAHVLDASERDDGSCDLNVEFTTTGLARLCKKEPELSERLLLNDLPLA